MQFLVTMFINDFNEYCSLLQYIVSCTKARNEPRIYMYKLCNREISLATELRVSSIKSCAFTHLIVM